MNASEKDQKYGLVYGLLETARKTHSALTKANSEVKETEHAKGNATPEKIVELKAAAKAAYETMKATKSAANVAQEKYNRPDVLGLLSYLTQVMFDESLEKDGSGRVISCDDNKIVWLSKMLMGVVDERHLPDGNKGQKGLSLAEKRLKQIEAFIAGFRAIGKRDEKTKRLVGYNVPKFGMGDQSIRFLLGELDKKLKSLGEHERAQRKELQELKARIVSSTPPDWLEDRKNHIENTSVTMGQANGSEPLPEPKLASAAPETASVSKAKEDRPNRGSGKRTARR